MEFDFDLRVPDSPVIAAVWRTRSEGAGSFISRAVSTWEMVVTERQGETTLSLRGPETASSPAPVPEDATFFGIQFRHGTYMPKLPGSRLVDREITLPLASDNRVWLEGSAWQLPDFGEAEIFVEWLLREGLLTQDKLVQTALRGERCDVSERTVQRRFRHATGLSLAALRQIERAREAAELLANGHSIADTVFLTGYADQPHLTRSLKRFTGMTPAQLQAAS